MGTTSSKQVGKVGLCALEAAIPVAVFTGKQILGGLPLLEGAHKPALLFQAVGPLQEACSTRSWVRGRAPNSQPRRVCCWPRSTLQAGFSLFPNRSRVSVLYVRALALLASRRGGGSTKCHQWHRPSHAREKNSK